MLKFFNLIWGTETGWVCITTYPTKERQSGKPRNEWSLSADEWFLWPKQSAKLVKYCERLSEEDLYMSVGVCEHPNRQASSIKSLSVIHCDADTASPKKFAVRPSIVVNSSPGRTQLYWVLKSALTPIQAEKLARAVTYSQRKNGSDFGWAANKLMRVPGALNTKPEYKKPFRVTYKDNGRLFTEKELTDAFGAVADAPSISAGPQGSLPDLAKVMAKVTSSARINDLYGVKADPDAYDPTKKSRYLKLYALACELFRQDLTAEEVFVICSHSANNKYAQDKRSDASSQLWRDVLKAKADVYENNVIYLDDDPDKAQVIFDTIPGIDLLSDKERKMVLTDTFIDRYTDWASTKTHADPRYHRANAMMIMSTTLAEFGYGTPRHGALPLHMWFMVLGVTSRSYKTTAANKMLTFLKYAGMGRDVEYELPTDITPESLNDELARRGEISSIYHVDEAHATIGDAKGGKGYMNGLIPLLTKLYDGIVPARSRITTGSSKSTRTDFTLSMLGVPGKMTESLTREDFASGFLARFLFVLGTPAARDPESRWLAQSEPDQKRDMDDKLSDLLIEYGGLLAGWRSKVRKNGGEKIPIRVEDDAWKRWNALVLQFDDIAVGSADPEAVQPTAERTTVAVHKLACLLAMSDGKKTVSMAHMVTAISYAEKWYDTMQFISSLVFANTWSRQVHELLDYLGKDQKNYSTTYRHFGGYKAKEFADIVESAQQQGLVRVLREEKSNGTVVRLERVK